jgi:DNA replication protein DnaC
MLPHPTYDRLIALGLTGMARALEEQRSQADVSALTFEERLALMIDREATERHNRRLTNRLRSADLRQNAVIEDIDLKAVRCLDRALFQKLVAGDWIERHQNLLIIGPTESDSYCPPRYAIRMPSLFDADRETPAAEYAVHPHRV